jgi:hypothetical protein
MGWGIYQESINPDYEEFITVVFSLSSKNSDQKKVQNKLFYYWELSHERIYPILT